MLLRAKVSARKPEAQDIFSLWLEPIEVDLPAWEPGAHVDVHLPDGLVRQYSLAGVPGLKSWRLGILLERSGRGGSRWLHEHAIPGIELTLGAPRNHFAYQPGTSPVVFIAGGIGITPLLPMITTAQAAGRRWQLHYIGRSRASMAYLDELDQTGNRVHVHARDKVARPDIGQLLKQMTGPADVYCCGPERLMETVEKVGKNLAQLHVHVERFAPKALPADRGLDEFEVEFAYSGKTVVVRAHETILAAAEAAGIEVPTSCREGTCGSCETPVLAGCARHLDSILSEEERKASRTMMICISRATSSRLVLDL